MNKVFRDQATISPSTFVISNNNTMSNSSSSRGSIGGNWEDHFLDKYLAASKSRSASPTAGSRSPSSPGRSSSGGEYSRKSSYGFVLEPKAAPTSSPKGESP